jgi:hypothetical protein
MGYYSGTSFLLLEVQLINVKTNIIRIRKKFDLIRRFGTQKISEYLKNLIKNIEDNALIAATKLKVFCFHF